ncbi:hypothetical protein HK102_004213 [Quaeritorhiza haematococci]|nr:hypothetical protein HK102_004213 [Quaeritorhiza haematococci]
MTNKDELFRQFIEEATRPGPEDAFIEQGGEIIKQVTASLNWFGKKWCAEWVGSRAKGTNVKGSDGDMMVKVKEKENGGDEPSWSSVATGKHCTEGAEVESKVTRKLRGEFGRTVVEALQQKGFRRVEEQGLWVALNFKYSVECDHIAGSDRPPTIECSIDVTFLHSKFTFPVMELVKNNFLEDPEVKVAIKSFKYLGKGRDNLPQLAGIEIEAIALASIDIEKGVSSGYSHFQDMVGLFGKHKSALSFNAFIKDMCKKRCFNYEFLLSEGNFNAYKQVAVHVLNWIKVDRSFEEIFSGVKTERLHANNTTAAEHVTKSRNIEGRKVKPRSFTGRTTKPLSHRNNNKAHRHTNPVKHKTFPNTDGI